LGKATHPSQLSGYAYADFGLARDLRASYTMPSGRHGDLVAPRLRFGLIFASPSGFTNR
jgi:hypothetical protein